MQRRIEAHITINFTAYKVYKELERQLNEKQSELSPEKVIDIAKTIFAVSIKHPSTKVIEKEILILNEEHQEVKKLFDF